MDKTLSHKKDKRKRTLKKEGGKKKAFEVVFSHCGNPTSSGKLHQQASFVRSETTGICAADEPAVGTPWWLQ